RDGRVPADPATVTAFDLFVAGEVWLVFGRDGVDVVRGRNHRHADLQLFRTLEQAQHDFACPPPAVGFNEAVEGLVPFGSFLGVGIGVVHRVRVLIVNRHPYLVLLRRTGTAVARVSDAQLLPSLVAVGLRPRAGSLG